MHTLLQDFFSGVDVRKSLPPEQVTAAGAALQAAIIAGVDSQKSEEAVSLDVAPLNIGVETHGGLLRARACARRVRRVPPRRGGGGLSAARRGAGILTEIIRRGEALPPPLPRTNRTSLVPPLVLSGHVPLQALPRRNVEMRLCTVADDQEAVLVQARAPPRTPARCGPARKGGEGEGECSIRLMTNSRKSALA